MSDEAEPTIAAEPPTEVDAAEAATAIERPRALAAEDLRVPTRNPSRPSAGPSSTIVTAADAMRDEEVHRTRVFIRLGWLASLAGLGTVPLVDGEPTVTVLMIVAILIGMVVSFGYHQAFRDPRRYGPRSLFVLGVMSVINTHIAILFLGALTLTPVLIVMGMHFVGRSDLSARRAILVTAMLCHGAIMVVLIGGGFRDPGVFASARPFGIGAYLIGALYVQASYALAYATGRFQRRSSLQSIQQLQRATRIASQRAALLDELRVDLERAHIAGSGRYTGQRFGGYRLGLIIGRGAHGEVYEAVHDDSEAPAAVKLLHREHLVDPTTVARFVREVRATAAIDSPHIVRVLATADADAPVPYLVMERLTGLTLAEQLRRTPALPRADVVALVAQIGAALDAAHAVGVIHRDLKPQNLIAHGATWKVVDFGVAALGEQSGTLTQGNIIGTPQYMAPEQASGAAVDHRADLYALGAIAYRALTGRNPFGGSDTPTVLYAVVHTMPLAPSALVELPADVDRWTALALAKDPASRWSSGAELAAQLAAAVRGELPAALRDAADALLHAKPWRTEVP